MARPFLEVLTEIINEAANSSPKAPESGSYSQGLPSFLTDRESYFDPVNPSKMDDGKIFYQQNNFDSGFVTFDINPTDNNVKVVNQVYTAPSASTGWFMSLTNPSDMQIALKIAAYLNQSSLREGSSVIPESAAIIALQTVVFEIPINGTHLRFKKRGYGLDQGSPQGQAPSGTNPQYTYLSGLSQEFIANQIGSNYKNVVAEAINIPAGSTNLGQWCFVYFDSTQSGLMEAEDGSEFSTTFSTIYVACSINHPPFSLVVGKEASSSKNNPKSNFLFASEDILKRNEEIIPFNMSILSSRLNLMSGTLASPFGGTANANVASAAMGAIFNNTDNGSGPIDPLLRTGRRRNPGDLLLWVTNLESACSLRFDISQTNAVVAGFTTLNVSSGYVGLFKVIPQTTDPIGALFNPGRQNLIPVWTRPISFPEMSTTQASTTASLTINPLQSINFPTPLRTVIRGMSSNSNNNITNVKTGEVFCFGVMLLLALQANSVGAVNTLSYSVSLTNNASVNGYSYGCISDPALNEPISRIAPLIPAFPFTVIAGEGLVLDKIKYNPYWNDR